MIRFARLLEKDFRVAISDRFVHAYKVLSVDSETKVFQDNISLFNFVVSLGLKHNKRIRFERKTPTLIRLQTMKDSMLSTMYSIMFKDVKLDELVEHFDDDFLNIGLKTCEEYAEAGMEIMMEKIFKNHFDGNYLFSLPPTMVLDLYQFIANMNFPEYFAEQQKTISKVKILLAPGYREEIRTLTVSLNFEQELLLSERVIESTKLIYFVDKNDEIVSNQIEVIASARKEADNQYKGRFELYQAKIVDLNEIHLTVVDKLTQIKELNKTFKLALAINDDLI